MVGDERVDMGRIEQGRGRDEREGDASGADGRECEGRGGEEVRAQAGERSRADAREG